MEQLGFYRTVTPLEITNKKGITIEETEPCGAITKYTYSFDRKGLLIGGTHTYEGELFHAEIGTNSIVGITVTRGGNSYQEVADRVSEKLIQVGLSADEFWDILNTANSFNTGALRIQHPAFGMARIHSIASHRSETVTEPELVKTVNHACEENYEVVTATEVDLPQLSQQITLDQYSRPLEITFSEEVTLNNFEIVANLLFDLFENNREEKATAD